ncbi:MAG: adenosine kinase [Bacteroidota bacterium]
MSKFYDVYGIGNAVVDLIVEVDHDFLDQHKIDKGIMTLVDEERQKELLKNLDLKPEMMKSGGSAANTIISVNQFGGKGYYAFKVANDDFGHFYIDDLHEAGVDTNLKKQDAQKGITGKCLVLVTPDADRTMNTFLGITSNFSKNEIREDALKNSKYVYLEGYLVSSPTALDAMLEAKDIASQNGVLTSLTFSDINMINFFNEGMGKVVGGGLDLIFGNEEEARAFTKTDNLSDTKEKMKTIAKTFVITLGDKGALAYDGTNMIDISPNKIQPIDSVGAGDMFAGAFLYGLTSGHTFEEAGKIASLASAKVVTQYGPRLDNHQPKELVKHLQDTGEIKSK